MLNQFQFAFYELISAEKENRTKWISEREKIWQ